VSNSTAQETPKWKTFERIVAAIHAVEADGAKITWNDKINGRQFDVTIRFRKFNYDFLVVIECKDYTDPVPAEKVDALVTKSRDANADKAIMIAANGFQSGCITVAAKHNITLISLTTLQRSAEELAKSFSPVLHLSDFRFSTPDTPSGILVLPDEIGVMRSLLRDFRVEFKGESISPEELISRHQKEAQKQATSGLTTYTINLPKGSKLIHPNTGGIDEVATFSYDQQLMTESGITGLEYYSNEPSLSKDIFEMKDAVTGETRLVDTSRIYLGFDTQVEVGKFYVNPNLGFSYYVEKIIGELVTYVLVESYQLGNLMQTTYEQDIQYSDQFVKIIDKVEIERLTGMLNKYRGN